MDLVVPIVRSTAVSQRGRRLSETTASSRFVSQQDEVVRRVSAAAAQISGEVQVRCTGCLGFGTNQGRLSVLLRLLINLLHFLN